MFAVCGVLLAWALLASWLAFGRSPAGVAAPAAASRQADEMLPLRAAVGAALEATRQSSTAGFVAGSDEEETVNGYFATMLEHGTPIYGRTPPAKDWVLLRGVDLSRETLWQMNSIKPHHEGVRITDLSVKRGDLEALIAAINARAA